MLEEAPTLQEVRNLLEVYLQVRVLAGQFGRFFAGGDV